MIRNFKKLIFLAGFFLFSFASGLHAMSKFKRLFYCCISCKKDKTCEVDEERLNSGDFACLPNEIIAEILEKLSDEDLMQKSVDPICKRFYGLVEYKLNRRAKIVAQLFVDRLLTSKEDLVKLPAEFRDEIILIPKKMRLLVQQNFKKLIRDLLEKEFKKQDCLNGDLFNKILPAVGEKEFSLLEDVVNKKIEAGDLRAKQIGTFIYQRTVNQQGIDFSDEIIKNLPEEKLAEIIDHFLKMIEIISTIYFSKLLFMLLDLNVDEKFEVFFSSLKDLVTDVFEPIYISKSKDEFLNKLELFHKKLSAFLTIEVVPLKIEIENLKKLLS